MLYEYYVVISTAKIANFEQITTSFLLKHAIFVLSFLPQR